MMKILRLSLLLLTAAVLLVLLGGCDGATVPDPAGEEETVPLGEIPEEPHPDTVTVYFDAGDGDGIAVPDPVTLAWGESLTIAAPDTAPDGFYFAGWSDGFRYYYDGADYQPTADARLTARWLETTSELLLLDAENANGWWGSSASAMVAGYTGQAIRMTPNGDDCVIFCHSWDPTLDLTAFTENGGMFVRLYVDDPDAFTGKVGRLEFSHDLGYHASSWALDAIEWKQGWNELRFSFDELLTKDGDFAAIDYMRLFLYCEPKADCSLVFDDLGLYTTGEVCNLRYETGFVGDEPYFDPSQATVGAGSEITLAQNPFEKNHYTFAGWSDGFGHESRNGARYTVTDSTVITAKWVEDPRYDLLFNPNGGDGDAMRLTDYVGAIVTLPSAPTRDGYVFAGWDDGERRLFGDTLYVMPDAETVLTAVWTPAVTGEGLVGAWDLNENGAGTAVLSALGPKAGTDGAARWTTHLTSKTFGSVTDFSTEGSYVKITDPGLDFTGDFTVSAWMKAPLRTRGCDRTLLSFGEFAEDEEITYVDYQSVDNMDGGDWDYCTYTTEGAPEGRGWCTYTLAPGEDTMFFIKTFKRSGVFDGYTEDGYLHMTVYAEHADNISGGSLEFTSSGGCDKEEISFAVGSMNLTDGWNEVYLPLANANHEGGEFVPRMFNYCRFYFFCEGEATLGIDDISVCRRVEKEPTPAVSLYLTADAGAPALTLPGVEGLEGADRSLTDGLWHHLTVSRAGDTVTYFVDGEAVSSCTVSGTCTVTGHTMLLGSDLYGENGFDGSMAEVRLYDTAAEPSAVTDTVIDADDNVGHATRLTLDHGLVFDRRQYMAPTPYPHELQTVTENDIINAINMGFDHVKLLLTPNHLINPDGTLKTECLDYITEVTDYVVKHDFVCYICLHPEDNFKPEYLGKLGNFENLCRWYGELAAYIGAHWDPDHVGLQLMTEPGSQNDAYDWSWFSDRMWSAVRNILPEHTIITSADAYGNIEYVKAMSPATDDNLIYSFTTYEPYSVGWHWYGSYSSDRNYWKYMKDVPYPVEEGVDYTDAIEDCIELVPEKWKAQARNDLRAYIEGRHDGYGANYVNHYDELYGRDWHFARAKSLDDWSKANGGNIHLMVVEWGCMDNDAPRVWDPTVPEVAGTSDAQRIVFLRDMRESFKEYGIGWSYWSYNEAHTIFTGEGYAAMRNYYMENCRETGDVPDENGHCFGISPDPETALQYYDWDLLTDGLGLTPLVERPAE